MAKVQIKSEKLTPFGGIFSIMEQFDSMLSPIIDQALGQRCRSIIGSAWSAPSSLDNTAASRRRQASSDPRER